MCLWDAYPRHTAPRSLFTILSAVSCSGSPSPLWARIPPLLAVKSHIPIHHTSSSPPPVTPLHFIYTRHLLLRMKYEVRAACLSYRSSSHTHTPRLHHGTGIGGLMKCEAFILSNCLPLPPLSRTLSNV